MSDTRPQSAVLGKYRIALAVALVAATAHAQPAPPLAQIRDEKQLAEALSAITQDPSIHVDDKARQLAQALMTEGVRQLQAQSYDQALANFLEAYDKLPNPKILLDVASTLRAMGRLADAANTYQRYILDPTAGAERMGEIKELLHKLDDQLTILTIRVSPHGSELSIDGGPFVAVGASLLTRVRAGIHLVRERNKDVVAEMTINGFVGETKEVPMVINDGDPAKPSLGETTVPDKVDGWLITGTQYGAYKGAGRERHVRAGYAGAELVAIVPKYEITESNEAIVPGPSSQAIASGALAMMRIDGKGRGIAGAFGIAYAAQDAIEIELAVVRSEVWGAYAGVRYRFLTGWLRPYAAVGLPVFFITDDSTMPSTSKIAVGGRLAGGVELMVNNHLSLVADLGVEYYFNVGNVVIDVGGVDKTLENPQFVPTLGLIGRL